MLSSPTPPLGVPLLTELPAPTPQLCRVVCAGTGALPFGYSGTITHVRSASQPIARQLRIVSLSRILIARRRRPQLVLGSTRSGAAIHEDGSSHLLQGSRFWYSLWLLVVARCVPEFGYESLPSAMPQWTAPPLQLAALAALVCAVWRSAAACATPY